MPHKYNRALLAVAAVILVGAGVGLMNPVRFTSPPGIQLLNSLPRLSAARDNGCGGAQPTFQYGFAELHARLGEVMGDPLECERPIHVDGDTRQKTTTGYAYYRTMDNVPTFTNGWDHWALTADGLVYWSGDVVDPPTPKFPDGADSRSDRHGN